MVQLFEVPENYFLSHSVGCLPIGAADALQQDYFEPWRAAGGGAWPGWLDGLSGFRHDVGAFLGTPGANICPQANVSSALTKIIYSLPKRAGKDVILLSPHDFPTIGFVFQQAERMGFRVRYVSGDVTDVNVWGDAMAEDVAMAHFTHVLSNTSQQLPVATLCALARERDVISIVDAAQSVGVVPTDIGLWQPDFLTGTSVKFLCGGPGACFMYASDEMLQLCEPIDVGWFSHAEPFQMDIHQFQYADDALRFLGGTPSPAPFILAQHGISMLQETGIKNVSRHVQDGLDALSTIVSDRFLVSPRDRELRGGTLVVMPHNTERFKSALEIAKILYDVRPEGFRFSVHGYTPSAEIAVLQATMQFAL
jgi:selenocysteine lyase/cysteine desulfurase